MFSLFISFIAGGYIGGRKGPESRMLVHALNEISFSVSVTNCNLGYLARVQSLAPRITLPLSGPGVVRLVDKTGLYHDRE